MIQPPVAAVVRLEAAEDESLSLSPEVSVEPPVAAVVRLEAAEDESLSPRKFP